MATKSAGLASKLFPKKQVGNKTIRFWNQIILVAIIYFAYEYTSSLASGAKAQAQSNALKEVAVERFAHIFVEQKIQQFFVQHALWLIKLSDLYYVTVHFVLPVVVFFVLFLKFPERYLRWRNTMALLNFMALAVFILFPVMPPRLLPHSFHFIDTQAVFGGAGTFDATLMKDAGNQYAAMPSLHFAWAIWSTLAIVSAVRSKIIKIMLLAHPIITIFVVIVSANHFFVDVIAGFVDFYLAFLISGGRHLEFWRVRDQFYDVRALKMRLGSTPKRSPLQERQNYKPR